MTRVHFEAIARALRETRPGPSLLSAKHRSMRAQWEQTAERIADACASFNGGFNRARFLRACGLEE